MIEIVLHKRTPNEIFEIVKSMRDNSMIQGRDFDFRYNQAKWDPYDYEAISPEHTVFMFYEEKYATWFQLRWA
jgi:hypothetical protein